MPTLLTLDTTHSDDGKHVLIAAGEIDLSNIGAFKNTLGTATAEAANTGGLLTVDLTAVEYLDSAAINALFAHADHIRIVAHPLLMSAFTISGLAELVNIETASAATEL
ncbi:STAS domain-containing protein [Mycobacterium vicinigordonae]|uniref:STAS domain-containing protein n=1 Tax=Mycobacterium vicinigordonae TaxID=1719132 RepID=A0A7D6E5E6_9MYCO|nr:STAS domain-containing protein [Mycobacterium vicinigordonae]QLL05725.1 STAS domain-containing protein [Mycobacterium vicinigordonae]